MGLPPTASEAVAAALVSWAGVSGVDQVVELGAGTGEIGLHLVRLPLRYVGLDNSPGMLDIFRSKAGEHAPELIVADCDAPWPLDDGSAAVVFASRVIHLLRPDHVVRETLRVVRPGGFLMLGRVQREPGSLKDSLQRQRQALLRERGIQVRQGERGNREVIARCEAAGCTSLGRRVAAEWSGETCVAAILVAWESLSRMGSVDVDPPTRAAILGDLREWARAEYGDPEAMQPFREQFVIDIVRVPALDVSHHG